MILPIVFGLFAVLFLFLIKDSVTVYGRVNPLTYLLSLSFLVSVGLGIYILIHS